MSSINFVFPILPSLMLQRSVWLQKRLNVLQRIRKWTIHYPYILPEAPESFHPIALTLNREFPAKHAHTSMPIDSCYSPIHWSKIEDLLTSKYRIGLYF